ncbi:MAG: hypothetical protein DRP87_18975 [Spirochaetes bacterium]|nr:MAG: hypothetical protein DRP87_18975 [Spirochaetota bacterium]
MIYPEKKSSDISRREFIRKTAAGFIGFLLTTLGFSAKAMGSDERRDSPMQNNTLVSLVKTDDRKFGVRRAIELLPEPDLSGKGVLLKPNFNTADPTPGSTHNDTLEQLIIELKNMGTSTITIGERSGPPDTKRVMEEKGIFELARRLGVSVINFEELPEKDWVLVDSPDFHWRKGFKVARPVVDAERIVSTCCLKTHGYGGVFTMSLKLSVGITHKSYMRELHGSVLSMRKMIAEINTCYSPSLIVLDGIETFVDGGPSSGERKRGNVFLAGTDRIAIDAVGLAILKELGSNRKIMNTPIFEQDQIKRSAELGLGVGSPEGIEIITGDRDSETYARKLRKILSNG